ncbi:MAG: hypothetical protein NC089_11705 [Bacteroides sp.]|nr:hypothetical protein [Bacteroides sp.]MCM1549188.1 hypothetical protein [Clostridium sp.]
MKEAKTIFDGFINVDEIDYNKFDLAIKNLYKILKPSFSKEIAKKDDEITKDINKRLKQILLMDGIMKEIILIGFANSISFSRIL